MALARRLFFQLHCGIRRRYSTFKNVTPDKPFYIPAYSTEEQEKVLKVINESNPDELSKYVSSKTRIKKLQAYKNRKGPFQSLDDILWVDGMIVKILENICDNIIHGRATSELDNTAKKEMRHLKNYLTPPLPEENIARITSVVGVHLEPPVMSWAKISRAETRLESWGYEDFSRLPTKMLPKDTFHLAVNMLQKIPVADVYVFESQTGFKRTQGKYQRALSVQQLELASMLLALLNTSENHNLRINSDRLDTDDRDDDILEAGYSNVVYYMKTNLAARLFKTLLGNERISNIDKITALLNNSISQEDLDVACTKIVVDPQLAGKYASSSNTMKDFLGLSLMMTITFMDIWIHKNPSTIKSLKL